MTAFIDQIVVKPGKYDMCKTCLKYVLKKQIPPTAAINGFKYLPIPDDLLCLTEVEEHLLALRIPFQQIIHLGSMGKFGQYGCKGSVINIPVDAANVINQIIPLLPEEDELYIVNLKRKLIHKRAYARNFVNSEKLRKWCVFLEKSTLYREYNVKFDENRLLNSSLDCKVEPELTSCGDIVYGLADDPENYEEMFARLGSIQSTLLAEDRYDSCCKVNPETDEINIAPGEKNKPISVVWDRKAEELSFPSIYLGESRLFKNYVTRYQAMKSEIRRYDRRSAKPQNVLYKFNVHLREQAASRLRHKFKRSCKEVSGNLITREEILDKEFIAVSQKKGISMPCLMPNSAEFWRGKSFELFAMVRQLNRPHLFITLSFAEYHCPILINILKRLNQDKVESINDDSNMEICNEEKLRLIRDDPIVCATYFREMVLLLKKYLRCSVNGPMGEHFMVDWFFRIEFQQRGSPHVHCLLWLNNCVGDPLKDKASTIELIDKLITCDSSDPIADKNKHKHTSTCYKNKFVKQKFLKKELSIEDSHKYCRFGTPFWPTNRTRIVLPLYEEEDERKVPTDISWAEYIVYLKELRIKMKNILSSEDCPDSLEEIWSICGCCDDDTYELAIRTGVVRATVLYKRNVADRWTNSYLKWILSAFISNHDAQKVLDVYSLVRYCVSYVTKGEKSHSKLHQDIMELRKQGDFDDRTLLKMLCSKSLRAKETSAQEAAWILLNFPLAECSRKCTFINTSVPEERSRCPKSKRELLSLPDGSTDLWYFDVFDVYSKRTEALENISLAEFVAFYYQSSKRRSKARIIRYRKFRENSDDCDEVEHFYRSMCTLYIPWRNEYKDILQKGCGPNTFRDLYFTNEGSIISLRKQFEFSLGLETELDTELEKCVAQDESEEILDVRGIGGNYKLVFDDDGEVAEFMDSESQNVDIDFGNSCGTQSVIPLEVRRRGVWDRVEFLQNIRLLNVKQREVVLAVIDGIRLGSKPRLIYVDGAAGTGKSVVAKNIANAFETFSSGSNNQDSRVMISAFTGKAAYNIGGLTMHQVYKLSLNQEHGACKRLQSGEADIMNPLQSEALANLQNSFTNVSGQIIDEISLVTDRNFLAVDQRCKEAKGNNLDFGGLWTIVFGDFRQLSPVGGKSVYASSYNSIAGSDWLWKKFEYVELDENMRQGDDKVFADILTVIGNAEGSLSEESLDLIESRFVKENNLVVPTNAVRLYYRNKDKDRFNERELVKKYPGKIMFIICRDRIMVKQNVKGMLLGKSKTRQACDDDVLEKARVLITSQAQGLPYLLLGVVGESYKLTVNQCVEDGLVNGAIGVLRFVQVASCKCENGENKLEIYRLWLRFPGNVGKITSQRNVLKLQRAIEFQKQISESMLLTLGFVLPPIPEGEDLVGLVPIVRSDLVLKRLRIESWRYVVRQQFPLVPALADTIHSSQGSTYDNVCVEYSEGMENEMVYVGMSRVKTLSGLFLNYTGHKCYNEVKLSGKRLFVHPKIKSSEKKLACLKLEKSRLRTQPFLSRWHNFRNVRSGYIRVIYHNIQSLKAHFVDVSLDEVFLSADVLLFAETWCKMDDCINLGGRLKLIGQCPGAEGNRGSGVCIFSKLQFENVYFNNTHHGIEVCCACISDMFVAVLYCHKNYCFKNLIKVLDVVLGNVTKEKILICGDFNVNLKSESGKQLQHIMRSYGLCFSNDFDLPTTYGGTCIDGVFCNVKIIVNSYQSYFSYHMPLLVDV
ncbi:ATP-dependent DNA helicase [Frankliniella fusca]|uniref:ATP-dependent DNA helicase n=1 Tax=Frankliniella fusca TaxID=407009 RepID=A0AAE1H7D8_9NEOP|nr:ATP-dependent DNA helicase [Frankliniella fusca]